jgi:hypothetical protein
VTLPAGSRIVAVELEACDDSATTEMTLFFFDCGIGPDAACAEVVSFSTGVANANGCDYFSALVPGPITTDNFNTTYFVRISDPDHVTTTRYRGVRVFYRRQVSPAPGVATFPNDVPTSHPYFQFVEALAAAGITGGVAPGTYGVDSPITRGQMAIFLAVALGLHWPL